jgi:uncharacterized protein YbbC (DUF1343 family)
MNASFDRLAGGPELRLAIQTGTPVSQIIKSWRDSIKQFLERRRAVLIYR